MNELKNSVFFILFLIILNLLFHFIPFERKSIAPDSYSLLVTTKANKSVDMWHYLLNYTYRPLSHYVIDLQSKLAGDNPDIGLILVFLSSLFVLITIFFLFNALFNDSFFTFIAALIFCLLPNKLETYHNTIFFNINMAIETYILSLVFFIYFAKRAKWVYFYASLFTYTIGVFWYEVGFFMPLVMAVYCFLFHNSRNGKYLLYFAIPPLLYIVFRLTGVFGLTNMANYPHEIGLGILPAFIELFHQFVGRYMIRSIIYGFYKFLSIEQPWLIIIICLDIITLITIASLIKRNRELKRIESRLLIFAGVIFFSPLIPNLLYKVGAIGGRHLVLPSIGIVIFIFWLLEKTKKRWSVIFLLFVSLTMIVSQGNAWTQVVACRINGAIYDTIKEKKEELIKADNIVIDTKSFADKIPFTFIQRDFNVLNTYYGAQALEDRTFESMVKLVTENYEKSVYTATESPKAIGNKLLEFAISEKIGYRLVSKKTIILPQEKIAVIDFKSVYLENFNNGIRKK